MLMDKQPDQYSKQIQSILETLKGASGASAMTPGDALQGLIASQAVKNTPGANPYEAFQQGQNSSRDQRVNELQNQLKSGASMLDVMEHAKQYGDKDSAAVHDAITEWTGNDPKSYQKVFEAMAKDPDEINDRNARTKAAYYASAFNITPPDLADKRTQREMEERKLKIAEGQAGSENAKNNAMADYYKSYGDYRDAQANEGMQKPMPAAALKLQQEGLDAIGTAKAIEADLGNVLNTIDTGGLDLGPIDNLISQGRNYTGLSNENSRNFNTFKSTLEKLRNDSLRLNKGVQTEGDSQRAWNEILTNLNDKELVKQRLSEVREINKRAAALQEMNVNQIRQNYGNDPIDSSAYDQGPAILNQPSGGKYSHLWE